jgi:hypothetical protein
MPDTNVYLLWSKTMGDNQIDKAETIDLPAGFSIRGTFVHDGQKWIAVRKESAFELGGFHRSESMPGIAFVCDPAP